MCLYTHTQTTSNEVLLHSHENAGNDVLHELLFTWDCKVIQPLWQFHKKINMFLPYVMG